MKNQYLIRNTTTNQPTKTKRTNQMKNYTRFTHTDRSDGSVELLSLVKIDANGYDYGVQITTGPDAGDDFVGLYDMDGNQISLTNNLEWELAVDAPADVVDAMDGFDREGYRMAPFFGGSISVEVNCSRNNMDPRGELSDDDFEASVDAYLDAAQTEIEKMYPFVNVEIENRMVIDTTVSVSEACFSTSDLEGHVRDAVGSALEGIWEDGEFWVGSDDASDDDSELAALDMG